MSTHRKVIIDHACQSLESQQALGYLCEEYKNIFFLHQGNIGDPKLLTMDIDIGEHPPIVQNLNTLPPKQTQWVWEELEMLEKAGINSWHVSPWWSPIVIVPKTAQQGDRPQQCLCADYWGC